MSMRRWLVIGFVLLYTAMLSYGSGGGGGGGGIGGTGVVRGWLTDAPACGYDQVNVTVERLRIHALGNAEPDAGGWSDIVLEPPLRVDLLTLQNGVLAALGETEVAAGRYRQMRLVLTQNTPDAPLANSVVPTGLPETALDASAGAGGGIKVQMDANVDAGQVVDVVLDFDACQSVVHAGGSGHYKLKPVIRALPLTTLQGQGITGHLDPTVALSSTRITVQSDGVVVKATTPQLSGEFMLYPIPAGNYDLVVTAEGRATTVVKGVPVTDVEHTRVGSALSPIILPPGPQGLRSVTGRVTPPTATTSAWQRLTAGTRVEVAFGPVDMATGDYAVALPIDVAWVGQYAADFERPIVFEPADHEAGHYTLEARSGRRSMSQEVDARAPVPPLNFRFR
jgi:hypothetical protein